MFVLGVNLPEHKLVKIALLQYVGIGHYTAKLICNRLQLHPQLTIGDMTEHQIGRLSALLSAPSTSPPPNHELSGFEGVQPPSILDYQAHDSPQPKTLSLQADPLQQLIIESDLRREVRANIAHHRAVGSYRGKRHALGFPVNGQRTHTNAKTAKKLNRVERRAYSTMPSYLTAHSQPFSFDSRCYPIFGSSSHPNPILQHSIRWLQKATDARSAAFGSTYTNGICKEQQECFS